MLEDKAACMEFRLAFAGPRMLEQPERLTARLATLFAEIGGAFADAAAEPTEAGQSETILQAHRQILHDCSAEARMTLLAGYALGADRLAVAAWAAGGFGAIHAVFPFNDPNPSEAGVFGWTHGPDETDPAYRVDPSRPGGGLERAFDRFTILDGKACGAEFPRRDGHLEQSRFLARWSNLAVVAWDGRPAGGLGGTADLVAVSLLKGSQVIWIDLSDADLTVRAIRSDAIGRDSNFGEFTACIEDRAARDLIAPPLTRAVLNEALRRQFAPPASNDAGHGARNHRKAGETERRRAYAQGDIPARPPFWWFMEFLGPTWRVGYRGFGRSEPPEIPAPVAPELNDLIEARFRRADRYASALGDAHRGTQMWILLAAILAVLCATLPALVHEWKLKCVGIEFVLIFFAYGVQKILVRFESHRIWSDTRRLAERLRVLRATWPAAFDVADNSSRAPETWTEWYARAVRRSAGPPSGVLRAERIRNAVDFARDDREGIVANQARYHKLTATRSLRMHHKLENIETFVIVLLLTWLAGYLGWSTLAKAQPSHEIGNLMLMASAILPVVAAVCLALEAKFGLQENGLKAEALSKQFEALHGAMKAEKSSGRSVELLAEAAVVLLNDVDKWREGAVRRTAASL